MVLRRGIEGNGDGRKSVAVAGREAASPVIRESSWTIALLALWLVAAAACVAQHLDRTGLGGRAWYGWWDAIVVATDQPFIVRFTEPRAGGASSAAGIEDGDRVDLRELDLDTRMRVVWQPLATRSTNVVVHRGDRTLNVSVTGSTLSGSGAMRRILHFLGVAPPVGFLACALLIILRRSQTFEGRALALYLLCLVIARMLGPTGLVIPDVKLNLLLTFFSALLSFAAMMILIRLSSTFGERPAWRQSVEWIAYSVSAIAFAGAAAACIGVWTMWFDPIPFAMGSFWTAFRIVAAVIVGMTAVAAVVASTPSEKPRAGWLLLPLPLALALNEVLDATIGAHSWAQIAGVSFCASIISLTSAALVTYALLKRRVLDAGFVLSRSIVVAILSLTVVAAFILLEWFLGSVVSNVSHATGIAANAALALVLGLSMRFIHQRVDTFVDAVMFRKRHENTRALNDFSKEAAFVTNPEALVDLAIEKVRKHTDARSAGLFFRENGCYRATRSFNEVPQAVSENDPAVLALKTWHRPLDPHSYDTALTGDLALPMVARGQLLGLLLCGERTGSEVYASDEIDALAQFAQGVGSALDYFTYDARGTERDDAVIEELRRLRAAIETEMREHKI